MRKKQEVKYNNRNKISLTLATFHTGNTAGENLVATLGFLITFYGSFVGGFGGKHFFSLR